MLFGDVAAVRRYRDRLHGKIYLLRRNHEKRSKDFTGVFESVSDLAEISVSVDGATQRVVLCHSHSHRGAWHLYGHSHGTLSDDPHALSLDVSVDCWNYAPVSLQQIAARMERKAWKPIDHHGRHSAHGDES